MADQFIQIPPQSTGLKVDCTELTVGANTVERERHNVADPTDAAGLAKVLSSAPAGTEYALITRNIPSGTQAVSGTVTTTPPTHASTNVDQLNGTTVDTNSGTKSAGTLRVVLATDQPALTNKLLVTADPITFASAQAVTEATLDAALISQEATTSGVKGIEAFGAVTTNAPTYVTAKSDALSLDTSGLLRVSLKDTPANTNKFLVTPDSVALPLHQSVNVDQLSGTTADTNSGTKSAGTLRVVLATDQPALTNKLLVTPDSVALPANQSVNVNQLAGTTTDTNSGLKSAGTLRVTLATDQVQLTNALKVDGSAVTQPVSGTVTVQQSTASNLKVDLSGTAANATALKVDGSAVTQPVSGTVSVNALPTGSATIGKVDILGNTGAAMDAAGQNAASPANELIVGGQFNTSPTTISSGNVSPLQLDATGNLKVNIAAGSSAGTQYAEGTNNATPTGTAAMGLNPSNVLHTLSLDSSGYLNVDIKAGAGSGGTAATDASTFTQGVTNETPVGGINLGGSNVPSVPLGTTGALLMTADRRQVVYAPQLDILIELMGTLIKETRALRAATVFMVTESGGVSDSDFDPANPDFEPIN